MNQALARVPRSGGKTVHVTDQDRDHMRQAIQLMRQAGVVDKTGGPSALSLFVTARFLPRVETA